MDYGLNNTLNSEGTEGVEKKEKTQVEGGRREEKHRKHQL